MLYAKHASWGLLQNHLHFGTGAPTGVLFSSSLVGHCPGGGLAEPQQLKDEVHPFLLIVPALGQETLPDRVLLQELAFGEHKVFVCIGFADFFLESFNSTSVVNQ